MLPIMWLRLVLSFLWAVCICASLLEFVHVLIKMISVAGYCTFCYSALPKHTDPFKRPLLICKGSKHANIRYSVNRHTTSHTCVYFSFTILLFRFTINGTFCLFASTVTVHYEIRCFVTMCTKIKFNKLNHVFYSPVVQHILLFPRKVIPPN